MANTKVTQHVIANNAITADQIASAAVTDAKLHSTLDLSGKTLTLPATAIPSASTATTQSASDNSTKIATTAYVTTAVANLVDSSPSSLDTLNELAAALNDDASFSTTVTNSIATKIPLAGGTMTGDLILGDNVKLEVGSASGGDLQIYHDGSNSFIQDAGTGQIRILGDDVRIYNAAGTKIGAQFIQDGEARLKHNNITMLATKDYGVDILTTGALRIPQGTTAQRPTAATGQMRWNTSDGALEVYNGSAWTAVGTGSSNKILDTFTGDGSTTAFTLTVTPANEDALIVFIDGVYQEKGDYALSNAVLTLDTAPASGEKLAVHITTASVHDGTSALNQQFTATSGQTAFTLSQDPKSENNTQVYINGVYQQKTDYTVSGTTLTFDTGLTVGDVVEVNMFTVTTLGNTDTVSEGSSNLYHTTARARSAISVSGNALSYNSSTGVITSAYEESPTFTGTVTSAGVHVAGSGSMILNNSTNWSYLRLKSPNTNGGYIQFADADDDDVGQIFYYHGSGGDYMSFTTNAAERMRIDANGNVGINNTECSHKLHVEENGTGAITSLRLANENTSVGDGSQILFTSGTSTVGAAIAGYGTALNQAALIFKAGGDTERMRISSTGNVGIGTSSPSHTLSVNASGGANLFVSRTSQTGGLYIESDGTNGVIRNPASNPILFQTNGANTRASVTNDGITFNGDTAAANALDDYEEGTWTPAFTTTGGVTSSITITLATYTKIGNICHIHANVNATLSSLPGQTVTITGLPFAASGSDQYGIIALGGHTANTGGYTPKVHFRTNGSQLDGIYYNASNNTAYWTYNTMDHTTFHLSIHGFYTTT